MKLEEELPALSLRPFINRYLNVEASPEEMPTIKILPTGYSYITGIVNSTTYINRKDSTEELPSVFLGGQISRHEIELHAPKKFSHFGIEFKAAGIYALLGIDMSETTDRFFDLEKVLSAQDQLKDILKMSLPTKEKVKLLDQYFLQRREDLNDTTYIDLALAKIHSTHGQISVAELSEQVNLSKRQFRRWFKKVCGIAPQQYSKIIQLRYVYDYLKNNENDISLTELAYESDFTDLSHFIKTFQKMLGESPKEFLESEDEFLQTYMSRA